MCKLVGDRGKTGLAKLYKTLSPLNSAPSSFVASEIEIKKNTKLYMRVADNTQPTTKIT